ncbi:MAG: mechanosensitive ion channel [Woeseia sp.]|nr:mechanosensitive ion channel [Woeseia sp.]MBT8097641.1 mechanosensitive ion channel [Woeseia sp.]NNF66855.1 mechanosensitive ion channel [Gammaproteobacteria bacterium]
MNELTNKISDVLGPAASSALGHALVGLGILIVGLLIVRLIVGVLKRVLNNVSALNRTNADGSTTDLVSPIASLFKAILTILVLIAVLQHFGLTDVLEPLKNMVNKFAAAVPNIIGAGVIGYAGYIIAKIVSQLVGAALGKVDEQLAERLGNKDISIAKLGSALIFAIILLPIAVSALGVLNIPAISEPASAMIQKLMAAVPNLIGAGIVLTVVFFAAKFVIFIVSSLLEGANINALPAKLGIQGLFTETFTPTRLIGGAIMFFSMVAAATAAVNILGIDIISAVFARILEFGGGLLVGGLILIIGNFLGTIVYNKLSSHGSKGVANIARFAILGLVLAMGLKAMGLADDIVTMAFGFTLGSVAVAGALAFGLGGRDAAKSIADNWAGKVNAR